MNNARIESTVRDGRSGAVTVYCLATLVVEEARREGCHGFAKSLEGSLEGLLSSLPRKDQHEALRLSYEMAIADSGPEKPRLRLVHSRD